MYGYVVRARQRLHNIAKEYPLPVYGEGQGEGLCAKGL